jgi:hypothetical protein
MLESRQRLAGAVEYAGQVGSDAPLPISGLHLSHAAEYGHTGIVDQDIESAQLPICECKQAAHIIQFRHIGIDAADPASAGMLQVRQRTVDRG